MYDQMELTTTYLRVLPRDLFNEAKLLKCIGQLSLLIHDAMAPRELTIHHDDSEESGFLIVQDQSTGGLSVANMRLSYRGCEIPISTRYNSRRPYPLECEDECGDAIDVFMDDGTFTAEFLNYLYEVEARGAVTP